MSSERAAANPFPGLRPFESDEEHLFFGRDTQIDEVLRRLRLNRFVAVVGTSGSGKSSLVRAGLLPRLHGGFMSGAGSGWRVTIFRPGSNPIGNLAEALPVLGDGDRESLRAMVEATLRRGALGLADAVRRARLPEGEKLLVVVDQFEELFRFKSALATEGSADDAAAFVKLLLEAAHQEEVPVYVLLTMRSDFLGDCAQFRDLPEAINDGQYLIPRMTRDQRREAITGPVAVEGATITPRLVNRLLNDVGDNPDQLPILQHALMRTWQQWALAGHLDDPLDLSYYEEIGGMAEAVSRHAEKAYKELPDERSRTVAEKLFKRLTGGGENKRESRRPTRLREICAVAEATEAEVVAVIDSFRRPGRSFLMPPSVVALNADTFIDISHESLTRGWKRLRGWLDDEALSARIFLRLADTAALYRQGEASLWRDPDLAIALAWRDRTHPNTAWGARYSHDFEAAMDFLEESRRARDAELAERRREQEERERQRKKTLRLTQALAAALLVGFLASAGLAYYAFQKRDEANQQRHDAESRKQQAEVARREAQQEKDHAVQAATKERKAHDEAEDERQKAEQAEQAAKQAGQAAKHSAAETEKALVVANEQTRLAKEQRRRAEEQTRLAESEKFRAKSALEEVKAAQATAEQLNKEAQRANKLVEEMNKLIENKTMVNISLGRSLTNQNIMANMQVIDLIDRLMQFSTPPEQAYWRTVRANALSNLQLNEEATAELDKAIEVNGDDPRALITRSYQHLLLREPEKAIEDARRSLKVSPRNAAAYQNLVMALGSRRQYAEAGQYLRDIIKSFTYSGSDEYTETQVAPDIKGVTGQIVLYAESDDALTALNYEAATLAAASGEGLDAALVEADKRHGSLEAYLFALNWAWQHEQLNEDDYGVLAATGALWERARYQQLAARAYERFQAEYRKRPDPRYMALAEWVERRKAMLPQATVSLDEEPPNANIMAALANAAYYKGQLSVARRLFNEAVKLDPTNLNIQLKRATFSFHVQDFDGARLQFDHILRKTPGNATANLYYALASVEQEGGMSDEEFREHILRAREVDPAVVPNSDYLSAYGEKVANRLARLSLDDAVDFLERTAKYSQPYPDPYFLMAKLLNEHKKYGQALKMIDIALAMKGDKIEYYLERDRAENGEREEARAGTTARAAKSLRDEAEFREAAHYADIGDTMSKFGDLDGALDAYGHSLNILDELAKKRGTDGLKYEVETLLGKISKAAEARLSRGEAAEYLQSMFGKLQHVQKIVAEEIRRLRAAP